MKKTIVFIAGFFIVALIADASHAQLINYERRGKRGGGAAANANAPKATTTNKAAAPTTPAWVQDPPKVTTKEEEKYDVNRDGILQSSEVKIMLRDLIAAVESKGGAQVATNVAKMYDKNKDGIINKYELTEVKNDAQ